VEQFHPVVRQWFAAAFGAPTRAQQLGWPAIARGDSTLILAPTGSGKTLTAFLWCLNRLMFEPLPPAGARCRVLYVSPLKALAVDIERNLRVPLSGIARVAAAQAVPVTMPAVAIRTGDTPATARARFVREPSDILITTPESLFLLLTSNARQRLASVDTVIVDEIHALVPGKRGAHLALSIERLEELRQRHGPLARPALQRIGLSATARPLDEVARFLGGVEVPIGRTDRTTTRRRGAQSRRAIRSIEAIEVELRDEFAAPPRDRAASAAGRQPPAYRPVTVIDAAEKKTIALKIEVPVADMAQPLPPPAAAGDATRRSIWASIYPRLLELIRTHGSTLIFVNSRRLAERLAASLNDLAGEPLVRAHHGSLARDTRVEVEDLLKAGRIRALVATSSLELGIDMGAIDLVVQIGAPPSVASGLQRIGRAGHRACAVSEGIIIPKFRGDLLACAAVARAMRKGDVEPTRYPRNPLDVLAQQIVAIVAMEPWKADDLFALVRRAAPFADLSRRMFDGVLDMLSGRYPSDDFAELRPRVTWDRTRNVVSAREGARRIVVANAGTIPDRGLYGVFLAGTDRPVRVGELDEEMVFETRVGETFTLGASTWRVEGITHDRVLVTPAPGEPGKMPFWHGDQAGRPVDLGVAIGRLVRELRSMPRRAAVERLVREHDLDAGAAENLLRYLDDQARSGAVADDRTLVVERCLDELGDWRVCLLSPFGSRVHAPWAMAAVAQIRQRTGIDVEVMWGDEGFVVRFPEVEQPPDPRLLVPPPGDVERLVVRQIGSTSLFAARFREAAARALLLPRRRAGLRTPLWRQRKRAADLLAVASRFGSFPVMLETYRELLRDHFDMPALAEILRRLEDRTLRLATIDSPAPSPFAASLLFSYVANYIYDGDAPLAERRAQALSVDQAQLRELLGDAELRDLLDLDAIETIERQLQHLDAPYKIRSADALHDLLIRIGDLTMEEIGARSTLSDIPGVIRDLERSRRIVALRIAGETRYAAAEDAARYRDGLGVPLPDLPRALLEPVRDPTGDLALRYARSHGPFSAADLARRYGLRTEATEALLGRLAAEGRLIEGEFRPGGAGREWVDPGVLRQVRRRSLAKLRHEIEPVDADVLGRFLMSWQGLKTPGHGLEGLLQVVEQLQGAAVPASVLEREILPARVADYTPAMLDTLLAAGEIVWLGVEPLGDRDGRVALYLTDHLAHLRPPTESPAVDGHAADVLAYLREHGASFFAAIHESTGGGFPKETVDALWTLVWRGLVTNDTLHPLRAYLRAEDRRRTRRASPAAVRSRRLVPPAAEGRWSAVKAVKPTRAAATAWSAAMARQLLARYGIVTRETVASDAVAGGFGPVYQALKTLEEAGRIRRGYFVAGLGGAQFAAPAALDLLRSLRVPPDEPCTVILSATDPANPYGAIVAWPHVDGVGTTPGCGASGPGRPARVAGSLVVLIDGRLAAYVRRGERELLLFAPDDEPQRSRAMREVARALMRRAASREEGRRGMLIADINGTPAVAHPAARFFIDEGFAATAMGLQARTAQVAPRGFGAATQADRQAET
jgi:ATP-dependent Lhr-like helicase